MHKVYPSYKRSRSYLQKKYVPPQKCARTCGDDKIMSKGIKENTGKTHLGNDLCGIRVTDTDYRELLGRL